MQEALPTISILYDLYGDLLPKRQRELFRLYYEENFSLAEISETCGLTRQGAHEAVRRATGRLHDFEEALGLYARLRQTGDALEEIISELDQLIGGATEAAQPADRLKEIRRRLVELAEMA